MDFFLPSTLTCFHQLLTLTYITCSIPGKELLNPNKLTLTSSNRGVHGVNRRHGMVDPGWGVPIIIYNNIIHSQKNHFVLASKFKTVFFWARTFSSCFGGTIYILNSTRIVFQASVFTFQKTSNIENGKCRLYGALAVQLFCTGSKRPNKNGTAIFKP